jgi:DNA processing protein
VAERDAEHRIIEQGAAEYPPALLGLSDPPEGLEHRGRRGVLSARRTVAIVGTRTATPYGRAIATRLGRELAALGVSVVSGLARGIDAAAHEGALEAGGPTVAVLPFGVEPVLPHGHAALAERIAAHGAVIAEWPRPLGFHSGLFLHRNRIIAGLADATVVVEAGARSGALSTARVALSLGRPCLAVPGDVDRPGSRGPHALLRAGARPCEGVADVLDALPRAEESVESARGRRAERARPSPSTRSDRSAPSTVPSLEADPVGVRLLGALDERGVAVEELARRLGWDVPRTLAELLPLEWSGVVERRPGARWARRVSVPA